MEYTLFSYSYHALNYVYLTFKYTFSPLFFKFL